MGRRFTIRDELHSVNEGIYDRTRETGTSVVWYRYDPDTSTSDDVYDIGVSRRWSPGCRLPVYYAVRTEGRDNELDTGLYTTDRMHIVAQLETFQRFGMGDIIEHDGVKYLKDRVEYDNVIFTPTGIGIMGTVAERDVIVSVYLDEVDPDELVNDVDFFDQATPGV